MHRFFVTPPGGDAQVTIHGADARHATRVLRLAGGDRFIAIVEGQGQFIARITSAEPLKVIAVLERPFEALTEPATDVWLFQCMPKTDKMDAIIQRATEIGASAIVPVMSSRTIPRPDNERQQARYARWRKIAVESAELSGRLRVPQVVEQVLFARALEMARDFDLRLMPWEQERARSMKQVLVDVRPSRVFLLIGPEGGFSEQEAAQAIEEGVLPVTLGPRMMRTENAGAVALSLILYELGDMG